METDISTPKGWSLKKINLKTDKIIPIVVIFLTAVSVVMVYSMRGMVVLKHLEHLLLGYVGMFAMYHIDYRKLGVFAPFFLILASFLLILTMLSSVMRSVTIFGRDVQTFYIIGFLIIFYIAHYIARQYHVHGEISSTTSVSCSLCSPFFASASPP
jgi:hypothetical protein